MTGMMGQKRRHIWDHESGSQDGCLHCSFVHTVLEHSFLTLKTLQSPVQLSLKFWIEVTASLGFAGPFACLSWDTSPSS